ncbi:MAG: hypothetical protein ACK48Y_23290, partial [Planctomyces sp.]
MDEAGAACWWFRVADGGNWCGRKLVWAERCGGGIQPVLIAGQRTERTEGFTCLSATIFVIRRSGRVC